MKKGLIARFATVLLLLALALAACTTATPDEGPATGGEEPSPSEPLVIGTTDSWSSFESAWVWSHHDWEIFHNCADGLLNAVPGTVDEVEFALATSYEISDDGLVYTVHLREGVVFPDGTPFNADAVVFTLERIEAIDTAEGANGGGLYYWYATGVEKIDDMTVAITFGDTYAFAPQLFTLNPWKILNPNAWSADTADTYNTACGIGPYVIESFTEGEELVLVANETYYGDAPKEEKVIIRYFADSSTMALALQNGEIDIAWNALSPSDTEAMRAADGITVDTAPGTEIRYIVFNTNSEPFDNPDVRFGLAQMLNREEIADIAFQGTKVPLNSMVPVGMAGEKPSYEGTENMEEGIALLASAGFTADNPLVMDLWYSPTHYGDTEADVAAVLKSQLEASGVVQVNLQFLEWAAYRDASLTGDFDVSLYGWYPDYMDPDTYITPFVPGSWAAGEPGYQNEEMAALVAAQASETDPDARLALLQEIQDLWVTESHMIPFAQGALFVAYRDGISGVVLDPLALFHFFLVEKE